ncbi:MAG: winged helix-turn-helix domain-containing protein [Candidatus Methanomethylophilaceae archaeon]
MLRESKPGDYELYAAADGVVKVTSGVERRILHALQDGDFTPTDLSYIIGRSRSTLSEYLNKLERDGLIASIVREGDARSKVYTLLSDPLVNSKRPDRRALDLSSEILSGIAEKPGSASNLILRSIILTFDGVGMDISPLMFTIGCDIAKHILPEIKARNVNFMFEIARDRFMEFRLGELSFYSKDPITVLFRDTVDLTQLSAEVMASFVSGYMVTILRGKLSRNYVITDSEIFGIKNNYIRMTFEPE